MAPPAAWTALVVPNEITIQNGPSGSLLVRVEVFRWHQRLPVVAGRVSFFCYIRLYAPTVCSRRLSLDWIEDWTALLIEKSFVVASLRWWKAEQEFIRQFIRSSKNVLLLHFFNVFLIANWVFSCEILRNVKSRNCFNSLCTLKSITSRSLSVESIFAYELEQLVSHPARRTKMLSRVSLTFRSDSFGVCEIVFNSF